MKDKIKIYYKGEQNSELDDFLKDTLGRSNFVLIGSGYHFQNQERDLEFENQLLPDYEVDTCDKCVQSTNHLNGICQKCK